MQANNLSTDLNIFQDEFHEYLPNNIPKEWTLVNPNP